MQTLIKILLMALALPIIAGMLFITFALLHFLLTT